MQLKNEESLFKLEIDVAYPRIIVATKYFHSLKILNQWMKRNNSLVYIDYRKYMLTDNGYERFHIFGNVIVPLSELSKITNKIIKNEEERIKFMTVRNLSQIQKSCTFKSYLKKDVL